MDRVAEVNRIRELAENIAENLGEGTAEELVEYALSPEGYRTWGIDIELDAHDRNLLTQWVGESLGIDGAKRFKVISGTRSNTIIQILQLNGVTPETKFTPRLAIRAAIAAVGGRNRVTVWAEGESHGYRLYANRHRRINLDYTV